MWEELYSKLGFILDEIPVKKVILDRHGNVRAKIPWESSALVRKRKEKCKAFKIFSAVPCMTNYLTLMRKQDELEAASLRAKTWHENKITENLKLNSRPFYSYIRSKSKVKSTVCAVKDSKGRISTSATETANILADYFESVFNVETSGPLQQFLHLTTIDANAVENKLCANYSTVSKLLNSLNENKAHGPDNIPSKLLKILGGNCDFVEAVVDLLNQCIKEKKIPSIWKTAIVIPLHKKGSMQEAGNYRPVSLTCILCKIYENVIKEYITERLYEKITTSQHGFMAGKSCISNLLETTDCIMDMLDETNCSDVIYFDFKKAFDQVSHYRLLSKLEFYGLNQSIISIVRDFLTGRLIKVKVGDSLSDSRGNSSGVPQGSVLGPLLFVLFVNDLPCKLASHCKLFADDLKLIVNPTKKPVIERDLKLLENWQNDWNLYFNLEKCKVLHIGKSNLKHTYSFLDGVLAATSSEKDLGISFDEGLNFSSHIKSIIARAKGLISWILRHIISRDKDIMLRIYKTLIRPNLEYCTQIWAPTPRHGNWQTIFNLESVQRQYTSQIRYCIELSYENRLKLLGLTTLLERRMRGDLIEVFKILNGYSNYGQNFFKLSEKTGNLIVKTGQRMKLDFFGNRVVKYWNRLPDRVKMSSSINNFKKNIDEYRNNLVYSFKTSGHYCELSDMIFNRIR